MSFEKLQTYLEKQDNVKDVKVNENEFISFKCGIAKPFERLQTQTVRDMDFVIGDIHTTNTGSKYNPTRILHIWVYPKNSKHLE
jgi:hypothetical protein